jgi:hypothetical protein
MNLLYEELPTKYGDLIINTDFRNCIRFELIMQDRTIEDKEKLMASLVMFYKNEDGNLEKAIAQPLLASEGILWFYRCGKEEKKVCPEKAKKIKQIYSYEFDNDYIFSAFYEQYGINLNTVKMHWFEFKALFQGLNDNIQFSKIMSYRAIDLSKIKDKEEKARYKRLKNLYALPDMRTQEEKEADFANAF